MFRLVVGAFVILLVIPVGAAQPPSTDPSTKLAATDDPSLPNGRLMPDTGVARVQLSLEIGCGAPPSVGEATVNFNVRTTAPFATVVLNPSQAKYRIPTERCADMAYREVVLAEAIVTTSRSAPAMASFVTVIEAMIEDSNGAYGPVDAEFTLVNEFFPLTVINPHALFVKTAPGSVVQFPFELQNLGNGPVVVEFDVAQPNKNKLDSVTVGPPIHLESRVQKGAAALFKQRGEVEIRAPNAAGYVNSIYQFNVKFSSRYDGAIEGNAATDKQAISFAVQVQGGLGGAVPAVSPLAFLGALAVVLLVLRIRP